MRKIIKLPEHNILDIRLDLIDQNENSRVIYKEHDIAELMSSMAKDGLLQPVGVRKEGSRYDTVFGNRRIICARKLGWHTIKAVLVDAETDNDRDILNLVENFKRQNTTVAEDGRMFQILMGRGLSLSEVASRVGVDAKRIQIALDVINDVPKDIQKKIVHRAGAHNTTKKGQIPAGTAMKILNAGRRLNMTKEKMRPIFDYAGTDGSTAKDVERLVPFLSQGMSVPKAIKAMQKYKVITVNFTVDVDKSASCEKKSKKSIHKMIIELVQADGRIPLAPKSVVQPELFEV